MTEGTDVDAGVGIGVTETTFGVAVTITAADVTGDGDMATPGVGVAVSILGVNVGWITLPVPGDGETVHAGAAEGEITGFNVGAGGEGRFRVDGESPPHPESSNAAVENNTPQMRIRCFDMINLPSE